MVKPRLDHYHGMQVVQLETYGELPHEWAVRLSGDIIIKNEDEARDVAPTGLEGYSVLMVAVGELDYRMMVGVSNERQYQVMGELNFNSSKYSITDPNLGVIDYNPSQDIDNLGSSYAELLAARSLEVEAQNARTDAEADGNEDDSDSA